jgi:glycosyltransferase involved in cell wall biosynthesis
VVKLSRTFPRLLVATEFPPNAAGGGPAVVRQMLKYWPTDCLFWWSCLPERDQRFGQNVAAHCVAKIPGRLYPNQRLSRLKAWMMENFWTRWSANHLRKTLARFSPDVVWAIPHLWAIPPLAKVLPHGNIGFHTTVQDYPDCHSHGNKLGNARTKRLSALSDLIYASAATRDATSHPMLEDLAKRTGKPGRQMLHAGIERENFEWLNGLSIDRKRLLTEGNEENKGQMDGIRIAYAGTIVVEKDFSLFVDALKSLRGQLREPLTLHFFGYHSYRSRSWFDQEWMQEHGNLPESELTKELRKCTWGFSPMALTDDDPRYNHFSFPTKFISYLAAGLPVITLGHPQSSVAKMAVQYNVGPCITVADIESIHQELISTFAIQNPAEYFRSAIMHCAHVEFDADLMRSNLHQCLLLCCDKTKAAVL